MFFFVFWSKLFRSSMGVPHPQSIYSFSPLDFWILLHVRRPFLPLRRPAISSVKLPARNSDLMRFIDRINTHYFWRVMRRSMIQMINLIFSEFSRLFFFLLFLSNLMLLHFLIFFLHFTFLGRLSSIFWKELCFNIEIQIIRSPKKLYEVFYTLQRW